MARCQNPGRSRAPGDTKHYTLGEAENIISALVDHVDCQAIVALACFTGLRPGEIQGLRWSDIEEDWIHIRRSIVRGRGCAKDCGLAGITTTHHTGKIPLALWRKKAGDNERVFPRDLRTLVKFTIAPALRRRASNGRVYTPVEEEPRPF